MYVLAIRLHGLQFGLLCSLARLFFIFYFGGVDNLIIHFVTFNSPNMQNI
jgi:hypothetical protein